MENYELTQKDKEDSAGNLALGWEKFKNKSKLAILAAIVLAVAALVAVGISTGAIKGNTEPLAEGCRPGDEFSETTGERCKKGEKPLPCQEGDAYNIDTGELCVK